MPTNDVSDALRIAVDVVEPGGRKLRTWEHCHIGQNVEFDTARLETYCFANWEPVIYDAMLVAAAVEFADRSKARRALKWSREIELRVPVHDPDRWNDQHVVNALLNALDFLTGDRWSITFHPRICPADQPRQGLLALPEGLTAVMPFSDGLDSCIVADLMARDMGNALVRVRLGSKTSDAKSFPARRRYPFTSIPYRVRPAGRDFRESSARSRGFKFALISGLAAYLGKAAQVIVPESGQGALGPALIAVGQGYEDYRSHPLFTEKMEKFLSALFDHKVRFYFPRLWYTKGETLGTFIKECDDSRWATTWSCWQQTRQVSVENKKRQCGICAACMLRRMSVHAAGATETKRTYVWEDLGASMFQKGAAPSFPEKKITKKMHDYAIAGALHLDHLAALRASQANHGRLDLQCFQLGHALGVPESDVRAKFERLLAQHGQEWKSFLNSIGDKSFVAQWAIHGDL